MSETNRTDPPSPPEVVPEASPQEQRELQPILGDLLQTAVRRLMERGRNEFGRAANAGRHRLEIRQQRKDLEHFWKRLGKTAYHLVEAGELNHPALRKAMQRIDELEARVEALSKRNED